MKPLKLVLQLVAAGALLAALPGQAGTLIITGSEAVSASGAGPGGAGRSSSNPGAAMRPGAGAAQGYQQQWSIEPTDVRLVDAFSRWAKTAGIQLRWDAARHVELGATDVYDGDIQAAMVAALQSPSILNSDFPLEVCFYPNRPALARVTRRGEQQRDCPMLAQPPFSVIGK